MKIQVEIPTEKLDGAVKQLKKDLEKAEAKIKHLTMDRDKWKSKFESVKQMKQDFEELCRQYSNDSNSWA